MASKAVAKISAAAAKTAAEISAETYQYPWREKLQKYKQELARGVWASWHLGASLRRKSMASKAVAKISAAAAKTAAEISTETYQYPWREKLQKYKHELARGVWGSWHLGAWKPLAISARKRARLRKEVLLAGEDWPYDPPKGEMRTKRKGHKVDRIASEKRANTAELMKKMPDMLLDYKKRVWEKRMKAEEAKD